MLSTVRNVMLEKNMQGVWRAKIWPPPAIGKTAHIISLFPTEVVIDAHSVPSFQFVVESVATVCGCPFYLHISFQLTCMVKHFRMNLLGADALLFVC